MVTSHPLAPPRDSADKGLAMGIIRGLPAHQFIRFGRLGVADEPDLPGIRVPIISTDGRPGRLERAQVAALTMSIQPTVDLVHVVATIGPLFHVLASYERRIPRSLRRPLIQTVPGIALERIDRIPMRGTVVALSDATASRLRAAGATDVRVIPPGVCLDNWKFRPEPSPGANGSLRVLFAGHHDRGGGATTAVLGTAAAARQALTDGRQLELVMAMRTRLGEDGAALADNLRRLARSAGLERLEIPQAVTDMAALIHSVDVVVLPATDLRGKADVPLVILEAMAAGRPVIVSDLPTLSALGGAVTRIPAGDPDALARALGDLAVSVEQRSGRVAEARALVERRFSERSMVASYGELYGELLAIREP